MFVILRVPTYNVCILTVVQAVDIDGSSLEEGAAVSVRLDNRPLVLVGMVTTHRVHVIGAVFVSAGTHCVIDLGRVEGEDPFISRINSHL